MARSYQDSGRPIKVPVAQVNQSGGFTLPTQAAGGPQPAYIQVGDFLAYFPYAAADKDFGAVCVRYMAAGASTSTNTSTGPGAAYTAALAALFTTLKTAGGGFLGMSESQFRAGETSDLTGQLNYVTANVGGADVEADCVALAAAKEVGCYVTLDGLLYSVDGYLTGSTKPEGTSGAYTGYFHRNRVSFFTDGAAGTGSTAVTSTYAIGQLIERAPIGATKVKIRLISQIAPR